MILWTTHRLTHRFIRYSLRLFISVLFANVNASLGVVGEGAEILILVGHMVEQLLCVDGDFRRFQKRYVNFPVYVHWKIL